MRHRWLLSLLIALPLTGHAVPGNQDKVTIGELYEVHSREETLTERQATYLMDVARFAQIPDQASWAQYGRGLYCLPSKTKITPEFLLSIVITELGSDRGWPYASDEPIDRIVVGALTFQYPCTDAAVAEHKKDREVLMKEVVELGDAK